MTKPDVADVDGLKVLEEVPVGHPETSVVKRLRVQLLPNVVRNVGPPCVVWVPAGLVTSSILFC